LDRIQTQEYIYSSATLCNLNSHVWHVIKSKAIALPQEHKQPNILEHYKK